MLPSQRDARWSSEYPKTLSSWLELDYFRRPRPHWRIRRRIVVIAFVACALAMAAITYLPGQKRIYQAAPVSTAHTLFNDDCDACHTAKFATMNRLFHGDDAVRSVSDEACQKCHSGEIHHERQSTTPPCASCHREHRDRAELVRIADRHCTSCHSDLKSHTNPSKVADRDAPFGDVKAFLKGLHPEFPTRARYKDPGNIKFSHQGHMNPEGVLVKGSLVREKLDCTNCHQPDAERRYMLPIDYQAHCARCHPLVVPVFDPLPDGPAKVAADQFPRRPAPHPGARETAETVRAVLRDRYLEFARRFPSVYDDKRPTPPPSPILGQRRTDPLATVKAESEWAEKQLEQASGQLFRRKDCGCFLCHKPPNDGGDPRKVPVWDPSPIPSRWMTHSRFSHDSHRALDCQQCHEGASSKTDSAEILMPKIDSCFQCHTGGSKGASADCVECHLYHGPGKARIGPRNLVIEQFLNGLGSHPQPAHSRPAGGSNLSR